MHSITKRYDWIAAHRLEFHSKCGRLHGHNYMLDVTVGNPMDFHRGGSGLDEFGFIIDFGDLNKIVKPILATLDHRYMVSLDNVDQGCIYLEAAITAARDDDIIYLPILQTSAEMLAEHIKTSIETQLAGSKWSHVAILEVRVWETPKASATY